MEADTSGWPRDFELRDRVVQGVRVQGEYVTQQEEAALLAELDIQFKRMRYEFDHWDDAIHGYRETERTHWQPCNAPVVQRLQREALRWAAEGAELLPHVHVLDLHAEGCIKPHVDSTRFCGDVIAGLCLLSTAVMRVSPESQPELYVDLLLPARSLYVLSGAARYLCTHEVLGGESSQWRGERVPRERRLSIICRTKPTS